MKNYLAPGSNLSFTAAAAITSGAFVVLGAIGGFAVADAAIGETATIKVDGVFSVTKVGSQAWTVGQRVYWDAGNSRFTNVGADGVFAGVATEAVDAGASSTTGKIRLNGSAPDAGSSFTQAANVAELTDSSTGTAGAEIPAIDDALTGVDGTGSNAAPLAGVNTELGNIKDGLASLGATQAAIIAALEAAGLMADS